MSYRRELGFLCTLIPLLGCVQCAPALVKPIPEDVVWMNRKQPAQPTTLNDLEHGRELYVLKCSGCHTLPLPQEYSAADWEKIVRKMIVGLKLEINDHEESRINLYLSSTSTRLRNTNVTASP